MHAPPLPGPALLRQRWLDATFCHWPVPADAVAAVLPAGVRPDALDGVTYVGLVVFRLAGFGPAVGPPLLPEFVEANVRVYGVDGEGRAGVVFLSMDVTSAPMAISGRAVGLPYRSARGGHRGDGAAHRYRVIVPRRAVPSLRCRLDVEVGDATPTGPLEAFLTARWGLHAPRLGRTWYLRNAHEPWPLRQARLLRLEDDLVAAAGFPEVAGTPPAHVVFSAGVEATFGRPHAIAAAGQHHTSGVAWPRS